MLLRGTQLEVAALVAERVRRDVEAVGVELHGRRLAVTVSIGVAAITTDMSGAEDVVAQADQAMYRAKRTGKNRVELSDVGDPAAGALIAP
jgi:diguanylate cyclase (GGDEF)-like protein